MQLTGDDPRRMAPRIVTAVTAALLGIGLAGSAALPADAAPAAKKYANCAALNKVYPAGVGLPKAKDKVAKRSKPVTGFTRNAKVYNLNRAKLDRDKDGIACEKHVKATTKKR